MNDYIVRYGDRLVTYIMPRRPKYKTKLHGLLPVDKPVGVTSMDVVRRVRHAAGFCKTGHAGTLDPLASGVVVCCLGDATRLVESLMRSEKEYDAMVDLSAFTATDDAETEREPVPVETPPSEAVVRAAVGRFVGEIEQVPPAYSAVHVGGQRAYQIVRRGGDVDLAAKPVTIHRIDVTRYHWPHLELTIRCGKGTYIRSLARDLGRSLDTGGHLTSLRRTRAGAFTVDECVPWERLEREVVQGDLLPMGEVSTDFKDDTD